MFFQQGVHRISQLPDSFPVNQPQLVDALLFALGNEIENDLLHIPGTKGVQIQDAVNRQLHWLGFVFHSWPSVLFWRQITYAYQGNPRDDFIAFPDSSSPLTWL